jgi:uncharacterized protein
MTETLQAKIDKATTIVELEDIYLPYKTKRKTKAQTAKENGLEPLSVLLLAQHEIDVRQAERFITENVKDADTALQGARDIIAETINEDAEIRAKLRKLLKILLHSNVKCWKIKKRRLRSIKIILILVSQFIKFHRIES